ncbi:AraC family transcriptional regulator [Nocardia macrotermitis]|uniref:AraC family transcriptional regulator n=1 Tax=Nocardia macrotermitis TaxID=2585198 RepID=UPI0029E7E56D|nr:AraC family transcriptional regulator [Nocardia macrotermitis]
MDVLSDAVAAMRIGRPHSSRTELRAPWGIRFPAQRGAGFHVVLQGACWLIPTRGDPIRLVVGDVAFIPRELGHAIADSLDTPLRDQNDANIPTIGDPTTVLLCGAYLLDQSRMHPLLAELPEVVHLPARVGRHPTLRGAIDLLGRELDADPLPGAPGVLPPLLEVLLLYILRAWHEDRSTHDDTGWAVALRDPDLAPALQAMHHDPASPWTVRDLAELAGLSRSAFAQRFTATLGIPPQTYLTWWRMTLAARLLREADLPLRTVATRVGYVSEYAFAKAFKREFGTAPGRYRSAAG